MSIWARWLLVLGALALFFHGKVIYMVVYALLLVYLAFRASTRRAVKRMVATRSGENLRLFPDERASVIIEIEHRQRTPLPWLLVEENVPPELAVKPHCRFALSMPGNSTATISYEVVAKKRGIYTLGPTTIETGDPFGVERVGAELIGPGQVLVYPRVHPLKSLGLPGSLVTGPVRTSQRHLTDPSRLAGLRDYIPGDSLSHIHWKATAHTGNLMVKKFEPRRHLDVAVLLDLAQDRYRDWNMTAMSELAIEVAASLVNAAAEHGQAFGLYILGRWPSGAPRGVHGAARVQKGPEHLRRCLELLAHVQVTSEGAQLRSLVTKAIGELDRETTVFMVTPRVEEATRAAAGRFSAAGFRMFLIEVSDEARTQPLPRGMGYARVAFSGEVPALGVRIAHGTH